MEGCRRPACFTWRRLSHGKPISPPDVAVADPGFAGSTAIGCTVRAGRPDERIMRCVECDKFHKPQIYGLKKQTARGGRINFTECRRP